MNALDFFALTAIEDEYGKKGSDFTLALWRTSASPDSEFESEERVNRRRACMAGIRYHWLEPT